MIAIRTTSTPVSLRAEKSGTCACGKRRVRSKTFTRYLNQFHSATRKDCYVKLRQEVDAWKAEPITCHACDGGKPDPRFPPALPLVDRADEPSHVRDDVLEIERKYRALCDRVNEILRGRTIQIVRPDYRGPDSKRSLTGRTYVVQYAHLSYGELTLSVEHMRRHLDLDEIVVLPDEESTDAVTTS